MPMTAVESADRHRPEATAARWRALLWLSIGLMSLGCLVGIVVPAGAGWDFANFYDTGHRVAAGQISDIYDPMTSIGGAAPQGTMRFWGTPISAVFYVPLSWFGPGTALVLFKIQNVAALVAALVLLYLLSRRFADGPPPAHEQFAAVFAFLCLFYQPFWTVFRVGGQTTPTVFLLFTLGLVCHVYERDWTAAACLVLAALIKPALAPALVCLVLLAGWSFLVKIGVLGAAAALLSVTLLGWPIHLLFLERMRTGVTAPFPWQYNSSLSIFIDSLHTALGAHANTQPYVALLTGLNYALKAITLATIGALVIKGYSRGLTAAAWRHFSVLVSVLFFLWWSFTLWEHYLALLFIPLIYIVASLRSFRRSALWLVAAVFAVSLGQNLIFIDWLSRRVADPSVSVLFAVTTFKAAPLILMFVFVWRHGRELVASYEATAWQQFATGR